jgi:hypothetical protein
MPAILSETEVRGSGKRKILYGWMAELDNGERLYTARRKHREIFRSGKQSISGAMQEEIAAWAIDELLLVNLRAKKVKFIGVRVVDTGSLYLTRLETFFDRTKYRVRDYTGIGRGGSRQRYVPLQHFLLKKGRVELNA